MNKPLVIKDNTPEEEAEIQRQIAEDPDAWPTSPDAKVLKRGRPLGPSVRLPVACGQLPN